MRVVLVANLKGGCGKTTIATHLAAAYAANGLTTALADADRQRSALDWLEARPATAASIAGLDWSHGPADVPAGIMRLVVDAPAGATRKPLKRLIEEADVVVVPVLPSAFDQNATVMFIDMIGEIKRVRRERARVGVVRNRLRTRSRAGAQLDRFMLGVGYEGVGRLHERAIYQDLAAGGLSLFDIDGAAAETLRPEWVPILRFVEGAEG